MRVRVRDTDAASDLEAVYAAFESFAPLTPLAGHLPSLPPKPIQAIREVGAPRPRSHHAIFGGQVRAAPE